LILRPGEIHGVRDPHGFRPLSIGRLGDAWLLSSETCAFDLFGATFVRDVEPGEHVVVSESGLRSVRWAESARTSACIFEHVYFARPDSMLFGANVHRVRMRLGERLAEEHPVEADLVTAVPESGSSAAMGYARRSGITLDRGFIKNHYVGRTFIKPSTELRQASVRLKLNAVPAVVRGKRVIVVDDSIIRGTTTHGRIRALKDAGAREVHMRVSCPPTLWPCFYGIDFPTRKELIAARLSVPEIAAFLEADSLGYLSLEGLTSCIEHGRRDYCTACFSGEYPAPVPSNAFRGEGTGRDQTS
jgi:amidophosphoribosyltransferase